jgi:hypothetical protein
MITNFEEITEDLTDFELSYTEVIKNYLLGILDHRPIKQINLCIMLNDYLMQLEGNPKISFTPTRLRKFINYFRSNGILPIIATSDGCSISYDKTEINKQIKSLEQRAASILKASEGLKKILNDLP